MKYTTARPRIRSGDLIAQSHKGWGSIYDCTIQLVRIFTRSEYCHVGVAWVIGGRVMVLEAVTAGVQISPLSRKLPFYWIPLRLRWNQGVEQFALERWGEPYSKWQAAMAGLGLLKSGADRTWQCAEYVQAVLKKAGAPLPGQPTPSILVEAALERPDVKLSVVKA